MNDIKNLSKLETIYVAWSFLFHLLILKSFTSLKWSKTGQLHVKNKITTNDFYNLKVGKALLSRRQNSEVIREKISRYDYIKHFTSLYSKNNIER